MFPAIELFVENNGIKIKSVAHVPPLETWDLFFKTAIADNKTVDNDVFEGYKIKGFDKIRLRKKLGVLTTEYCKNICDLLVETYKWRG